MKKIQSVSRVALATLYFLQKRYHDAGEMYRRAANSARSTPADLDLRMSRVRSLYLAGDTDSLAVSAERIISRIETDNSLWTPSRPLADVYLNVPLVLAQQYLETRNRAQFKRVAQRAETIYDRVARTWPDSAVTASAAIARMNLQMMGKNWTGTLKTIREVLPSQYVAPMRGELELIRAEVLAWGTKDTARARKLLTAISHDYDGSRTAAAARFDIAVLELHGGQPDQGVARLVALEADKSVDESIRARAMLARARHVEKANRWDEAVVVLRRIMGLYPDTEAAMEAPLIITQHYARTGHHDLALQSLKSAREYYLTRIERGGNRSIPASDFTDMMIETYLSAGKADAIASLLESRGARWKPADAAGALIRSAAIYSDVLDNPGQARRVLEKCIEMYPESRYAKLARREMEQLQQPAAN